LDNIRGFFRLREGILGHFRFERPQNRAGATARLQTIVIVLAQSFTLLPARAQGEIFKHTEPWMAATARS
jgi:hypothetical protein